LYTKSNTPNGGIKMNINNISEGQIFKNYKALCLELNEPIKNGKSKKLQLEDWKRYFEYSKSGNSYIINKINETPTEKIDGRGKKSIYSNAIQLLITDLLARRHGHITISKHKLMLNIGMINVNYGECGKQVKKLSKYIDMDEKMIYDFYNINNTNLTGILETALNNLEDKSILMYNRIIKLCELGKYTPRVATKYEVSLIMECEKETLEELGFENKSKVRVSNKWTTFQKEVQSKLSKISEIKYYYSAYEIIINQKYIEQERNKLADLLLEQVVRDETLDNLNSTIIEQFVHNSELRNENGFTSGKMAKVRTSKEYIDNMKELASLLINKNASNILPYVREVDISFETYKNLMDDIDQLLLFGS
jgi:hypothetical protein